MEPGRVAIPLKMVERMVSLGKWMRFVGLVSSFGLWLLAAGLMCALPTATHVEPLVGVGLLIIISIVVLAAHRAILLYDTGTDFTDARRAPEPHHELVQGLGRLRPVFAIELAFLAAVPILLAIAVAAA